jgi:hypothetical protein
LPDGYHSLLLGIGIDLHSLSVPLGARDARMIVVCLPNEWNAAHGRTQVHQDDIEHARGTPEALAQPRQECRGHRGAEVLIPQVRPHLVREQIDGHHAVRREGDHRRSIGARRWCDGERTVGCWKRAPRGRRQENGERVAVRISRLRSWDGHVEPG